MTMPSLPAEGDTSWYDYAGDLHDEVAAKVTGTGITEIRAMTQAAYDALGTKVATTLYVITA